MSRRITFIAVGVLALSLMCESIRAVELSLETVEGKKHSAAQRYLSMSGTGLRKTDASSYGLPKGPGYSGSVLIGRNPQTPVTFLFTSSTGEDTKLDELRVGLTQKPDLSKAAVYKPSSGLPEFGMMPYGKNSTFKDVKFTVPYKGKDYPVVAEIMPAQREAGQPATFAIFRITGIRVGKIELDSKTMKLLLIDRNGNGLFDDQSGSLPDALLMDVNGNGKLDRASGRQHAQFGGEAFPRTPLLKINSKYYSCDVPASGASLELKAVEPEMGTITTAGEGLSIELIGPIYVDGSSGSVESFDVPVGKYMVMVARQTKKDQAGEVWTLLCGQGNRPVEVLAGQTTKVPGAKVIRVMADISGADARRRQISARLVTKEGLVVQGVSKGSKRPDPPGFEIRDAKGELIASGKLKYG